MSGIFEQLQADYQTGGMQAALDRAETTLRKQQRYHELFEVLKMQARHKLGQPVLHQDAVSLSEAQQRQLEDSLLAACRDVGFCLLQAGQIQESWGYLKHLTDQDEIRQKILDIKVTEENVEAIIGLLLYEGLDCDRGFALVLEKYGTCNAITTMQNALYGRSRKDRCAAGQRLVAHVHRELLESVKAHIERQAAEGGEVKTDNRKDAASECRLADLIQGRGFLFENGSYHIDTSHLSSTVQIAVELSDAESWELALDLTRYGEHLHADLQYPSHPPFEDTYPSHAKFFSALLGQDVDSSVSYFRDRAVQTDAHQEGTQVIETYVDLLARIGRPAEAMEALVELIPPGIQTTGRAPTLYDLSQQLGDFTRYRELCVERDDLLGYVVGLEQA